MESFIRNLLLVLALTSIRLTVNAQPGTWAWMHGSQTGNCLGVFGTQGVPAPSNSPPCLYETAHWTDQSGNFWMFGGLSSTLDMYSDLWRFEPATNMWTWMNGPQLPSSNGIYGVQGVPSPLNYPGSRSYGANCWVDNNGDLWLFGGFGYDAFGGIGSLNDLWRYSIATNEWTWMKGPNTAGGIAMMGVIGVPSPTNLPPAFAESNCTWVDGSNNLWMFGGVDFSYNPFDQVWRYNTSTNEWTWMKGGQVVGVSPNYGTLGVTAPTNTPGCRGTYASWTDCNGDFWMYGGTDFGNTIYGDLWKLSPVTLQWTWMAGTNAPNATSNFSSTCTPSTIRHPSAAWENRAVWRDAQGRLLGFGGALNMQFDASNLLWCYSPYTQEFTWVSGSQTINAPSVYGTLGVGAPGNVPSGRGGAASFMDAQGNLWLYGGFEFGAISILGDLWKFTPNPQCNGSGGFSGNPVAAFTALPSNGCAPLAVAFTNTSSNATGYQWDFGDGGQSAATNPSHTYANSGTYSVMLIALPSCGGQPDTAYQTIVVSPGLPFSLGPDLYICVGDSLILDAGNPGATYLWYDSTAAQTHTVIASGTYWVQVTFANGCVHRDSITVTVLTTSFSLGPDHTICPGASITLDAGNSGSTYLWSDGAQTQTNTFSTGGDHWVQVNLPSGCIVRDTVTVTLLPLPIVDLGTDRLVCPGTTVLLDAGLHPSANILWSTNASSPTIAVTSAGTYWVQVTDAAGCQSRDSVNIVFAPLPVVALGQDSTICEGSSLTLDAGNPGNTFLWSSGETTQTITATQAGLYSVVVTTPEGCFATGSVVLTVTPDFAVDLGPDTTFCEDRHWTLTTALPSLNGFTHLWSTGQQTERITVTESGTYSVHVANPCFTHDDAIQLTFRADSAGPFIPTAFTPNGDGLNDVLLISGLHTDDRFNMQVYDRWGMRIFTTDDPRQGWDGTLHGRDTPEGIYVIRLQVTDCRGTSRPRQASVTLIR